MCLRYRLSCFLFKVGALVYSLDETFKWILRIVGGLNPLFILLHVHGVDADVI